MTDEIEKVNHRINEVEKAVRAIPLIQQELSLIRQSMERMIKISEKQYDLENQIQNKDVRNDEAHKRMIERIESNETSISKEETSRINDISKLWGVWVWIARIIGGSVLVAVLSLVVTAKGN